MRIAAFVSYALAFCGVAAVLAACGSGFRSSVAPSGPLPQNAARSQLDQIGALANTTGGSPSRRSLSVRPNRAPSWMSPDAAKTKALLYVSNLSVNNVTVYSYPKGKLVGTLTTDFASPDGICVDKKNDIWIVNNGAGTVNTLVEYKHGEKSPIATLNGSANSIGCAIDPTTGNLAVTSYGAGSSYPGNVAIFKHAKGTPRLYTDSKIGHWNWLGYDPKGNLYADGTNLAQTEFFFAELPMGKKAFKNITLKGGTIYYPGNVQWDGKYVAVGDQEVGGSGCVAAVYQTTGAGGKIVHKTPLDAGGCEAIVQFWIDGDALIGPNSAGNGSVGFYKYPAGGKPWKVLTKGFDYDQGSAISK